MDTNLDSRRDREKDRVFAFRIVDFTIADRHAIFSASNDRRSRSVITRFARQGILFSSLMKCINEIKNISLQVSESAKLLG